MSYSVRLVKEYYNSNYTSNIYTMLDTASKELQKQGKAHDYYNHWTDELKAFNSRNYLIDLINELKSNSQKYEKLQPKIDPKTGERWGSYKGCIQWLENILANWKDDYEIEIEW